MKNTLPWMTPWKCQSISCVWYPEDRKRPTQEDWNTCLFVCWSNPSRTLFSIGLSAWIYRCIYIYISKCIIYVCICVSRLRKGEKKQDKNQNKNKKGRKGSDSENLAFSADDVCHAECRTGTRLKLVPWSSLETIQSSTISTSCFLPTLSDTNQCCMGGFWKPHRLHFLAYKRYNQSFIVIPLFGIINDIFWLFWCYSA